MTFEEEGIPSGDGRVIVKFTLSDKKQKILFQTQSSCLYIFISCIHSHIVTVRENSRHLPLTVKFTVKAYFVNEEKTQYIGQIVKTAPNTKDHGTYYEGYYAPVGSALVIIDTWPSASKELSFQNIPYPFVIDKKDPSIVTSPSITSAEEHMNMNYMLMNSLFKFPGCHVDHSDNYDKLKRMALNVTSSKSALLGNLHKLQVQLSSEMLQDRTLATSSNEPSTDEQIAKLLDQTQQILARLSDKH